MIRSGSDTCCKPMLCPYSWIHVTASTSRLVSRMIAGYGIAIIRDTSLDVEAVTWIHEYGHNIGLQHVSDPLRIMNPWNDGTQRGLDQAECNAYHTPDSA